MTEPTSSAEISAAKQGNDAEIAAIVARHMKLIHLLANRATGPGLDFDDAVQEGLIGLFSAIKTYDATQGASFSTYAGTCVQNAIATAQKAAGRKKHAPLNYSVPIPEGQSIPGPEDAAIASEQLSQTLEKARTSLSSFEREVLWLCLDGFSYNEIAMELNRAPKAVDNALKRLRRKLK